MAEKTEELNSMISPFSGAEVGGTISSPVGMIPNSGRFLTGISVTPPAKNAPISAGVTAVLVGAIISPIQMSSPTCRTCCQGGTAARSVTLPASSLITSSAITTASAPSGSGSPVSTTV